MDTATLRVGDRVYRYVWVGGERQDPQPLTIVKVRRATGTVRVRTDVGSEFDMAAHELHGFWDKEWDL